MQNSKHRGRPCCSANRKYDYCFVLPTPARAKKRADALGECRPLPHREVSGETSVGMPQVLAVAGTEDTRANTRERDPKLLSGIESSFSLFALDQRGGHQRVHYQIRHPPWWAARSRHRHPYVRRRVKQRGPLPASRSVLMAEPLINSVVETLAVENAANRDVLVCLLALTARKSDDPQRVFVELSHALSKDIGRLPERSHLANAYSLAGSCA